MNIIYVSDQYWPSISGVSVSLDAFKKELEKKGHTVHIFAPDYPEAKEFDDHVKDRYVHRFKSSPVFITKENRLVRKTEKRKIAALIDQIKPDLIHIHTEFSLGKMCMRYARKKKIKVVASAHTNWEDLINLYIPVIPHNLARILTRHYIKSFYNKADTVIVPTSLMETLLHLYFVSSPTRIIPTGILMRKKNIKHKTLKEGKASPVLDRFPELRKKRILFFAGRLGKEKNIPFLLDVFEKIKDRFPDLVLMITGDGPEMGSLRQIASDKNISGRVVFTGYVEKKHIDDYYLAADVFVFASKVESQGLVVLEAMSCGTPVVAIGKMGTRELMSGDNGGFMVDDDISEFTGKVIMLLENRKLYKLKSEDAVRHAGKWCIEVMADKMIKLYSSLITSDQ